jgi:hypothetical protein
VHRLEGRSGTSREQRVSCGAPSGPTAGGPAARLRAVEALAAKASRMSSMSILRVERRSGRLSRQEHRPANRSGVHQGRSRRPGRPLCQGSTLTQGQGRTLWRPHRHQRGASLRDRGPQRRAVGEQPHSTASSSALRTTTSTGPPDGGVGQWPASVPAGAQQVGVQRRQDERRARGQRHASEAGRPCGVKQVRSPVTSAGSRPAGIAASHRSRCSATVRRRRSRAHRAGRRWKPRSSPPASFRVEDAVAVPTAGGEVSFRGKPDQAVVTKGPRPRARRREVRKGCTGSDLPRCVRSAGFEPATS